MYTIEVKVTNRPPNQPAYSWTCPLCDVFGTGDNLQLAFVFELAQHHLVRKHGVISEFNFKTVEQEKEKQEWHSKKVNIDLTLDTIWTKDRALSYTLDSALREQFKAQNVVVIKKIITNIRDIN